MIDSLISLIYVISRYLHIVAMAMILGGTVFYLLAVPFAIDELKVESQQVVFARARIIFRWVILLCTLVLLISGAILTARSMWVYRGDNIPLLRQMAIISHPDAPRTHDLDHPSIFEQPNVWYALHVAGALLCVLIAVALVRGGRPPTAPLPWMRLNLGLLLVTVLFAVLTRNARQQLFESIGATNNSPIPITAHEWEIDSAHLGADH